MPRTVRTDKERMSPAEVARMFLYDPLSGELARCDRGHGIKPGRPTSGKNGDGYRVVRVKDRMYLVHRLAWVLTHGEWPEADIDHINGVRLDNRIANLRPATRSLNNANSKRPRTNKSGYKGVSWHAVGRKWLAQVKADKQNHYLGLFDDPVQAHAAYVEASRVLFGEYARSA